jgi:hypothetical protein
VELGFTWCGDESEQTSQCVLCYEVLANECMKPEKLRRHLETKHCDVKNKKTEFFQIRLGTLNYGKDIVSVQLIEGTGSILPLKFAHSQNRETFYRGKFTSSSYKRCGKNCVGNKLLKTLILFLFRMTLSVAELII